ncbi:thioredoxin domain-containing protein [Streptomyces sp. DSM 44917]|uniref:Thioredoxin domain-containing protein n=1 Tax=Streptomyces boetiae TaxID=3075541 RepID=A0ABU2LD51_9ACTN|nr:thioredoxin domain-containing protein [Streptomyces sp. DSM 44917]MDT0309193.1 thioredoxin domain-containing protein [Streptomyces sp. DSM 44917]
MSKRNSAEAKRAARERLRAERERQARRDKIRRQLVVGGSVLAVLALAAGIGVAVANRDSGGEGDSTDWEAVLAQVTEDADEGFPTAAPANTSGENGRTIRIGPEDAANTVTLYEDPRCPICAQFEQQVGEAIQQGVDDGDYAVEYVFGTFLDRAGATGSKNALSALGAALDVSPEAFLGLHEQLYSEENHPPETLDEYADDERLIEIAQSVPELEGNDQFAADVRDSTFAVWALQMSAYFNSAEDVEGTPAVRFNEDIVDTPRSPADWEDMVEANSEQAAE